MKEPAPSASGAEAPPAGPETPPLISVILPVYNRQEAVVRAAESVLAQTYPRFELLIVNDGSTDGTESVCRRWEHDRRVRLFSTENRGVSAARNLGLSQCRGQYFCFLDSDDEYAPDALEKLIAPYLADGSLDLVTAGYRYAQHPMPFFRTETLSRQAFLAHFSDPGWLLFLGSVCGKLYRTDLQREHGFLFDETMRCHFEDSCFNLAYYAACQRIRRLSDELYTIHNLPDDPGRLSDAHRESLADMLHDAVRLNAANAACYSAMPKNMSSGIELLFLDALWRFFSRASLTAGRRTFVRALSAYPWKALLRDDGPAQCGWGYRVMRRLLLEGRFGALRAFFRVKRRLAAWIPRRLRLRFDNELFRSIRRPRQPLSEGKDHA